MANLVKSPLCANNERLRTILEIGRLYEEKYGTTNYPTWNQQLNELQGGRISTMGGPYHSFHVMFL
jgi:hypothetical protein